MILREVYQTFASKFYCVIQVPKSSMHLSSHTDCMFLKFQSYANLAWENDICSIFKADIKQAMLLLK